VSERTTSYQEPKVSHACESSFSALLTARKVAKRLDVSVETVLRWHRAGRLPAGYRLASGVLRWRADELEAWLEERREVVSVGGEA
jgi:excisionase family DNA binding protein